MAIQHLCCCTGFALVLAGMGHTSWPHVGCSWRWLLLLQSTGSRWAGFSSCGSWTSLPLSMWGLPGPGMEPVSPALAGRLLTTGPPGKSLIGSYRSCDGSSWSFCSQYLAQVDLRLFSMCMNVCIQLPAYQDRLLREGCTLSSS